MFYYVWGFMLYIVSKFHNVAEGFYLNHNNPFLIRKRTFKYLSYFEKVFLVLFHREGWFNYSIGNLFRKKDIVDHRRKKYPLIYFFHMYYSRMDYQLDDLKLLAKQYDYYFNSEFFKVKLNRISRICFKVNNSKFIKFLVIQNIFFRRYYNLHSSVFFKDYNNLNTLMLNWAFNIFLINAKYKFILFDLNNWFDWYNFAFNKKIVKYYKVPHWINMSEAKTIKFWRNRRILKWQKVVLNYKKRYIEILKFFNKKLVSIPMVRFSFANFFKIKVNKEFQKLLSNYYTVKFSESSVTKHINANELKHYNFFYIRKNRIFNKGRYSRNRQLYRTGVYWCLWLNIIMVYGLYFIFYRFTFNFGYIWWGILILAYSTIFSRIVKYNFFNVYYLYNEFINLQKWYGYLYIESRILLESWFKKYFYKINLYNYISKYGNYKFDFFFDKYYYYIVKIFLRWIDRKDNAKIVYLWMGMKEKDTSWFRYKTVIHWFKEIYRLLTTW